MLKKIGIGCGGLIGLIFIAAVIAALANGSSGKNPTSIAAATTKPVVTKTTATSSKVATQAPAASAATQSQPSPTPVLTTPTPAYAWGTNKGDEHFKLQDGVVAEIPAPGSKGVHQVSIVKITDNATSSNEFEQPESGKKFWAVQVVVANTGNAEIYTGSWKLRTADDFEYDEALVVGFGDSISLSNLTPGAKVQGTIVFEIPAGAVPKFLRYDPNPLAKGDLYFDE